MVAYFVFNSPFMMMTGVIYIFRLLATGRKFPIYIGAGLLICYVILKSIDTISWRIENESVENFIVNTSFALFALSITPSRLVRFITRQKPIIRDQAGNQDVQCDTH
jgi:hypothetical protein